MIRRLVMIVARQVQRGKNPMYVAVTVVERQRDLQFRGHLLESSVAFGAPIINPRLAEYACLPGVSMSIVRIERQGTVEQTLRFGIVLPGRAVVQHLAGQHAVTSRHVGGSRPLRTVVRCSLDTAAMRRDDRSGDLFV